jgi:hypothetical protein
MCILTVTKVSQPPAAAPAAMLTAVEGLLMLCSLLQLVGREVELYLAVLL